MLRRHCTHAVRTRVRSRGPVGRGRSPYGRGRRRFQSSHPHGVSGARTPTSSPPAVGSGSARTAYHTTTLR
jgi:hypothetical protein